MPPIWRRNRPARRRHAAAVTFRKRRRTMRIGLPGRGRHGEQDMATQSRFDPIGAFLIGAAVATGNPALADWGLLSIVLPALVAAVLLLAGRDVWTGMRWAGAVYVAFIFLWYEQYKLTGAEGSTDLFTTLTDWLGLHGHEKFMRIGVACCVIIVSIFMLIPTV